jgi:hypothetical protein
MMPRGVEGRSVGIFTAKSADVVGVETVDVLVRTDALDHRLGIDVRRQRQLHQDAVDAVVGVEAVDQRQQFVLGRRGRQVVRHADHAGAFAGAFLVAHVDGRGGIVADQNHRQAGTAFALDFTLCDLVVNHCEDGVGHRLAVKDMRAHRGNHFKKSDFPGNGAFCSSIKLTGNSRQGIVPPLRNASVWRGLDSGCSAAR